MANRTALLIGFLVLVIVILVVVVVFSFWIKPTFDEYAVEKQNEGFRVAISSIVSQVKQNGFIQLLDGNETMILVQAQPPTQQAQPTQQIQQPIQ